MGFPTLFSIRKPLTDIFGATKQESMWRKHNQTMKFQYLWLSDYVSKFQKRQGSENEICHRSNSNSYAHLIYKELAMSFEIERNRVSSKVVNWEWFYLRLRAREWRRRWNCGRFCEIRCSLSQFTKGFCTLGHCQTHPTGPAQPIINISKRTFICCTLILFFFSKRYYIKHKKCKEIQTGQQLES